MPTYDYVCESCGHQLELFQSMSESPRRKCPACGQQKLRRRIGAGAGILFRGSGFYQTDYRSSSWKQGESGAKESTKEGSGEASTRSSDAPEKPAKADSAKPPGKKPAE
jgi:putative FmdB family regulatory protein